MSRENDVPMVETYKVESSLVHSSKTRRAAVIISILATICVICSIIGNILIVDIFTSKYNTRTKDWIDLVKDLVNRPGVTEVDNAEARQMEQLPFP